MIEHEQHSRNHEHHCGKLQIVPLVSRHRRFEKTNHVVTDVTDCAANKMGNVPRRDKLKTRKDLFELRQWIALVIGAVEKHERIETDKREPAGFFISFRGFKKKTRTAPVFFSSRRRHTRFDCDWSSDVCSSD